MTDFIPISHLRLILAPGTLMGPGKADLLQGIVETGSIAAAGRRMGMSYKRAWMLIDTMNAYFGQPLVNPVKGGKAGGGAQLTPLGQDVLRLYRQMQSKAEAAIAPELQKLALLANNQAGSSRNED